MALVHATFPRTSFRAPCAVMILMRSARFWSAVSDDV